MKKLLSTAVAFALLLVFTPLSGKSEKESKSVKEYTKLVNPFVGTDFHGHTFPGATYPFGMVQLSPDTRLTGWDGCSGYHYSDSAIYGFSHTHLSGTGVADYCDILLMPVSGYTRDEIVNEEYKSPFQKGSEKASPGFYEVFLDKWGVKAELTAGRRVGFHKYTYKPGSSREVVLDLAHRDPLIEWNVEIAGTNALKGYRRSRSWATDQVVYFFMEFSEPFSKVKMREMKRKVLLQFADGSQTGISNGNNPLMVKVGISSVSTDNAKLNLEAECGGWNFEGIRRGTERAWNEFLGKIEVESENEEQLKTFYTALYHTAIAPNLISDVNGEYRGMDRKIHKAEGYEHYTIFSLWDTYRTLHPLMTIIERERTSHFIQSMLAMFRQGGKLPIWELAGNETNCMIGYHSVSVITDAVMKGIGGFDKREALNAMVESSRKDEYGIREYMKQGFVPADLEHESVSKTLEYAYDDWCIAQMAKELGEEGIYLEYSGRAQSWKNIVDPQTGFMRPRVNGGWLTPFDPSEVNVHFTEANSWQYSFYVPHDLENHIEMLGGDKAYIERLDALFSAPQQTTGRTQVDITGLIGQYAHGNEPSHHIAYLYNYAGEPWKTQQMVRRIMDELYSSAPDGLSGNEDCGQMSAWYVMSALGFYPVTPGDPIYTVGSPLFKSAKINLESGKVFTVKSKPDEDLEKSVADPDISAEDPNKSAEDHIKLSNYIYVKELKLNGEKYTKSYISHKDIENGGELIFETSATPSYNFGVEKSDRPVSRMSATGSEIVAEEIPLVPWFEVTEHIFKDSSVVKLVGRGSGKSLSEEGGERLFWRVVTSVGKDDVKSSLLSDNYIEYTTPIVIKENTILEACSVNKGGKRSPSITCSLRKVNSEWKITLLSKYNRQYNAGGDEGLIDGVRGTENFRLGGWQGYQNTDFTAIVDLGSVQRISKVGAGFLQDARSWIWMPRYAEFFISDDGEKFELLGRIDNKVGEQDWKLQIQDMILEFTNTGDNLQNDSSHKLVTGRYIKVFAKNYGTIPDEGWHEGAGGEGFIFIDEIIVEIPHHTL